jgi:YfiH family protein
MIGEIKYPIFQGQIQLSCHSFWKQNGEISIDREKEFLDSLHLLSTSKGSTGENHFAYAQQVHGNKVSLVRSAGLQPACDGLVTAQRELKLIIRTADCAAVMIYHPEKKVIANLHVGWRGVQQKIIQEGINILRKEWAIQPDELLTAVSPFIQSCCYEVGEEFYKYFSNNLLIRREDKIFFDLKSCIYEQLLESGILMNRLEISTVCTSCGSLMLPSYRRNKTHNRLINMIEIRGD